jgi:hypothetical protein
LYNRSQEEGLGESKDEEEEKGWGLETARAFWGKGLFNLI